jgi:hypothetical protein
MTPRGLILAILLAAVLAVGLHHLQRHAAEVRDQRRACGAAEVEAGLGGAPVPAECRGR